MKNKASVPIDKYLGELELAIKQVCGVVPEDALCDAREYLHKDALTLLQSDPSITDDEIFGHFVKTFGKPHDVAKQYEDVAEGPLLRSLGYARGWRISCTKCGRSAPAAKAGITRVGVYSSHKYVVGWCRDCRWLRFMRIEKDLDRTNLMDELGVVTTAEELRKRRHRPVTVICSIVALVALVIVLVNTAVRVLG